MTFELQIWSQWNQRFRPFFAWQATFRELSNSISDLNIKRGCLLPGVAGLSLTLLVRGVSVSMLGTCEQA